MRLSPASRSFVPSIFRMLIAAALSTTAGAAESTERTVTADYTQVAGPRSEMWRESVGAARAAEGLRADWQEHLKIVQDEIGFRAMRFHGIFHDDMGVYTEDKDGNPVHNWQYVDLLYDALLEQGIRPFVEIGFTPIALASDPTKSFFWWKGNPSLPKDWDRWQNLVTDFVNHLTARYGREEVRKWHFEVWNEPDIKAFFYVPEGQDRTAAYLELYDRTARAVKKADPEYRVGGPATAGPKKLITDLIAYCDRTGAPLDFITFHAYGLDRQVGGLDPVGDKRYFIRPDVQGLAGAIGSGMRMVAQSSRPDLPVYITEWNTSYAKHDPVHDSYYNAAHNLGQIKETEKHPRLGSMSRWTFTDVFEEDGVPPAPFWGGFGLINLQGIKKPAFFAYKYLAALGGEELVNADPFSWVTRDAKGGVQALIFDHSYPMAEPLVQSNREFFGQVHPPLKEAPVRLELENLPPGTYQLAVRRTGFRKNDPFTRYLEMGSPKNLSRDQVAELKALTTDQPESEESVVIGDDGRFVRTFPLRSNDIYLVTLDPVPPTR